MIEVPNVKPLTELSHWDACLEYSKTRPVFVFKHSTACPVSTEAYQEVVKYAQSATEEFPLVYLVKVIEDRPVSNQIAEHLGVPHKSPQIILVRNGNAVWNSSHYGIRAETIREAAGKSGE